MDVLISQRAYGRSRRERGLPGGSLAGVQTAIATGRIRLVDGKIDPELADREWEQNTHVEQQARGKSGGGPARRQPAGEGEELATQGTYLDHRARRELAEAQLAELELREKTSELVRSADVSRETRTQSRALRDRVLVVPDRLAPVLAAEMDPAKVHQLLMHELKNAFREFVAELAAGPA